MNILMIMIPIAIFLGAAFLTAFIIAASKGQFDDTETPALRILIDDDIREEQP